MFAVINKLKELHENLTKGAITVKELEYYKVHVRELKALCESANLGKTKLCPPFAKICSAMIICSNKLKCAKTRHLQLSIVVEYCRPISNGVYLYVLKETFSLCFNQ